MLFLIAVLSVILMGLKSDDESVRDQTELGAEFASDDCSLNKAEGPMQDIR
jgi:hypothetical protein